MSFIQYIKDTRGELRHVAWPTRTQTVIYTILVASVSLVIALYLGLFDYIFTTTLTRFLMLLPGADVVIPAADFTGTPGIEVTPSPEGEVTPAPEAPAEEPAAPDAE